jgi:hypothetical protein
MSSVGALSRPNLILVKMKSTPSRSSQGKWLLCCLTQSRGNRTIRSDALVTHKSQEALVWSIVIRHMKVAVSQFIGPFRHRFSSLRVIR